nr:hypothetical protein [Tanacetum cinerariifolium]
MAQNQQGYNAWQDGGVQVTQNTGIQLQVEEFDFMAAASDLDEIKEVNANCILIANLQHASTSETSSAPNEETRAHQEIVYRNLIDQVAQVNVVNCNMRATNSE